MEIKNKIKESGLIQMDLSDFKPDCQIIGFDMSERLNKGLVLKEKVFRQWLKEHDWSQYKSKAVHIHCSTEAIVPTWAYMLVMSSLQGQTEMAVVGSQTDLEKKLIEQKIHALNLSDFKDERIIIKGCSDISVPEFAMAELVRFLQSHAKSIMYGEPCSTVPIYKKKKP